jgi:hypothetical protein
MRVSEWPGVLPEINGYFNIGNLKLKLKPLWHFDQLPVPEWSVIKKGCITEIVEAKMMLMWVCKITITVVPFWVETKLQSEPSP